MNVPYLTGEQLPQSKLNAKLVKMIREEHAAKEKAKKELDEKHSAAALAKRYGVHIDARAALCRTGTRREKRMNAKLIDGQLAVNVAELIYSLSDDDKGHIIELLSCDERLIENVAAQIVDGWTEAGYHSGISYGPLPHTALDKARRLVAKAAPDLRDKAITRLEEIAVRAQKDASEAFSKQLAAERKAEDYRRRYDSEVAF